MQLSAAEMETLERLIQWGLDEDLKPSGFDLTSETVIPAGIPGRALLVARGAGVIAGLPAAEAVFKAVAADLDFIPLVSDGDRVNPGTPIARVQGAMRSILTGERTALNFVQRLSGIATLTRQHVDRLTDLPCLLLDTRKTLPGWRLLEKYAVRCGGGHNHRMGLGDGILIKDNHLAALVPANQAIARAVELARNQFANRFLIEVEVDTLDQLDQALIARADVILLDNMSLSDLQESVRRRDEKAPEILLEASGGVNLQTIRAIAQTGVDRISVGGLTHSAMALDIAVDYQE